MPLWRSDLHIHTVLSGCAEPEMIPPLIVERALDMRLDVIAIADHNSAANAAAVIAAAGGRLVVKPGLEVETRETVHMVCIFDEVEQALSLQELVYARLPGSAVGGADPFGPRLLVDERGLALAEEARPLFSATDLSVEDVVAAGHERGGLVLAAHIDRRAHGLVGVLGFVPAGLKVDGLEAGPGGMVSGRVASSDAHRLLDIGSRYTVFEAANVSVEALRECIAAEAYRTGVAL